VIVVPLFSHAPAIPAFRFIPVRILSHIDP
jgi:hypothetical protein